jgi:hypothetical protein
LLAQDPETLGKHLREIYPDLGSAPDWYKDVRTRPDKRPVTDAEAGQIIQRNIVGRHLDMGSLLKTMNQQDSNGYRQLLGHPIIVAAAKASSERALAAAKAASDRVLGKKAVQEEADRDVALMESLKPEDLYSALKKVYGGSNSAPYWFRILAKNFIAANKESASVEGVPKRVGESIQKSLKEEPSFRRKILGDLHYSTLIREIKTKDLENASEEDLIARFRKIYPTSDRKDEILGPHLKKIAPREKLYNVFYPDHF